MQRIQAALSWAILASETSHVFCCVIPGVISLLSLMASLGLTSFMPAGLLAWHEMMHAYEIPVIIASGLILLMGWGLHALSVRIDCHSTGCAHGPCKPKKQKSSRILLAATILFAVNLAVFFGLHYGA